jgi:hypothetical protein
MSSMGLWRWNITRNIAITTLDSIHRPVFNVKHNSTLQVFPYLTENTLRLRHEPNRLILSIGLWLCYINILILDIIQCPVFHLKHDVSETGFGLLIHVEATQLDQIDRTNVSPNLLGLTEYVLPEQRDII